MKPVVFVRSSRCASTPPIRAKTVIVKAHSGHARLSRAVFDLGARVVAEQGLPAGVLIFVEAGASREAGTRLVQHSHVGAVAFTGSYQGGTALWRATNERKRPIPFFGELGSINSLVVLPAALAHGVEEPARTLAASITLGCGQFCTSPGVIVVFDEERIVPHASGDATKSEALGVGVNEFVPWPLGATG